MISTHETPETLSRYDDGKTAWFVTLSDGSVVWSDGDAGQAWRTLRRELADSKLTVDQFHIKFRSRVVKTGLYPTPLCFFSLGEFQFLSGQGHSYSTFIIGFGDREKVCTEVWQVPELIISGLETRQVDLNHPGVIYAGE